MAKIVTLDAPRRLDRPPMRMQARGTRGVGAVAPSTRSYRVEWQPLAFLDGYLDVWKALAARALEPNVFYEPAFARAAAPVFGRDVGAILVWSAAAKSGEVGALVGLLPVRVEKRRYGAGPAVLVGWTHPYAPFGAPLIDRDGPEAVLGAALDFLTDRPDLPDLLLLPFTPSEGPFAAALGAALLRCKGRLAWFGQHRRALLAPGRSRTGYLARALSPRKRKELRRQVRRLADSGEVRFASATTPPDVADALDRFMTVEADGWKGQAGTAAILAADIRGFMQCAVAGLAAEGQVSIDRLLAGDRDVAAAIMLRSGSTAWFWKIAYDEAAARTSPGVQVTLELTRRVLEDGDIARVDSCATKNHAMIDHLWRERLVLADHLAAVGSAARGRFALACFLEGARRAAIDAVKRLRTVLRLKRGR